MSTKHLARTSLLPSLCGVLALLAASAEGRDHVTASPTGVTGAAADAVSVGSAGTTDNPDVIAQVGPTTVTVGDLLVFSRKKPFSQQRLGPSTGRAEVLRQLIENRLVNIAAMERAGLEPGAVAADIQNAVDAFQAGEFAPDAVSAADVTAYYERHEQSLGIPASVRIRDIVVPFSPSADVAEKAVAQARAEALRSQAMSGASFEALASKHADTAALRRVAGDRGYLALSDYPYLQEATASMQVGDLSDVIELPTGYQVFQLLGRREGVRVSQEEAEVEIRRRLQAASIERKREDFFRSFGNKLGVHVMVPDLASAWPWPAPAPSDPVTGDP